MLPVRSETARVPVGERARRPRRTCDEPLRPRRLAIGVILFGWLWFEDREPAKDGVWKDSWRRMRWWTRWYRWRNKSVLWLGGGKNEGFVVDLKLRRQSMLKQFAVNGPYFSKCFFWTL
jgi:hypothetical protein